MRDGVNIRQLRWTKVKYNNMYKNFCSKLDFKVTKKVMDLDRSRLVDSTSGWVDVGEGWFPSISSFTKKNIQATSGTIMCTLDLVSLMPVVSHHHRVKDIWWLIFQNVIIYFSMTMPKEKKHFIIRLPWYVVIGRQSDSCRWALGSSSCHSWFVFFPKPKHRSVFNFVILGLCQTIMANNNQPRAQLVWRWVAQPWSYWRRVPDRIFKNPGQTCRHP